MQNWDIASRLATAALLRVQSVSSASDLSSLDARGWGQLLPIIHINILKYLNTETSYHLSPEESVEVATRLASAYANSVIPPPKRPVLEQLMYVGSEITNAFIEAARVLRNEPSS